MQLPVFIDAIIRRMKHHLLHLSLLLLPRTEKLATHSVLLSIWNLTKTALIVMKNKIIFFLKLLPFYCMTKQRCLYHEAAYFYRYRFKTRLPKTHNESNNMKCSGVCHLRTIMQMIIYFISRFSLSARVSKHTAHPDSMYNVRNITQK